MPHLNLEIGRRSLEQQLRAAPIEKDSAGNVTDILAPPVPFRFTSQTPTAIRVQLIVESIELQAVLGSSQCIMHLQFDQGSVEQLGSGKAESLLGGGITIPFFLRFIQSTGAKGTPVAQLVADFTGTVAGFAFDVASKARLIATLGAGEQFVEQAAAALLTAKFTSIGAQPTNLTLDLTPGVPSESLLTIETLPTVAWVNADSLALSLAYAPETSPPPFQPVPFLHTLFGFGFRLSNDGFQRTVRNPAVRKAARDNLSNRLLDGFVQQAYAARGGKDGPTDQDRADGQQRLEDYLKTPQGLTDIANETPAPTGNGRMLKHITKVPDPFSDFDVEIPEVDFWLGTNRVEGHARATGKVNGIGFTANVSFRATPVLVTDPRFAIEMHDVQIDDPDIDISLPVWLEVAAGVLTAVFAGPVFGALVAFLLSSVVSSIAEAFMPSDLAGGIAPQGVKPSAGLPPGVKFDTLSAVPEYLELMGEWFPYYDDPRPFWPRVFLTTTVSSKQVGFPHPGVAYFTCLSGLGVVMDADPQTGTAFSYLEHRLTSTVTARLDSSAVPLPLTLFPWSIQVGYRSPEQYHLPVMSTTARPLVAGPMTFTCDVWRPEPPLRGTIETQTFTIDVQQNGDTWTLDVPADSHAIVVAFATHAVDATGMNWNLATIVDVPNETVTFGADFDDFTKHCARQRRNFLRFKVPSLLDQVWNPPDVYSQVFQEAIRTEQPAVTQSMQALIGRVGNEAFNLILAPSLVRAKQLGPTSDQNVKAPAQPG